MANGNNPIEYRAMADVLFNRNSHLDFVKRIKDPNSIPSLDRGNGVTSTHSMRHEVDANGQWYIAPSVVNVNGKLVENSNWEDGEKIPMPSRKMAEWVSKNGYKKTTYAGNNFAHGGETGDPVVSTNVENNLIRPEGPDTVDLLLSGIDPNTGKEFQVGDSTQYIAPTRYRVPGTKPGGSYDSGFRFGMNQEYNRGENQGAGRKLWNGFWSRTASVGWKVGQGAGHVLGFAADLADASKEAIAGQEQSAFFENTFDNVLVNAFDALDEKTKELMPVHMTKDYVEGNMLNKMMTAEWWASDMFDGIAFMASAFVPGAAAGKVFKATKGLTSLLTGTTRAARAEGAGGQLAKILGNITKKTGLDTQTGLITAYNVIFEAGFEGKEVMDSVKADLRQQFPSMSEEEIQLRAGDAAAKTFGANVAALALPNFYQTKWFGFGKGVNADEIRAGVRAVGGKALSKAAVANRYSIWKEGVKGFLSEGAWEENIQTGISNYEHRAAMGGTNDRGRYASYAHSMVNGLWGFAKAGASVLAMDSNKFLRAGTEEDESAMAIMLGGLLGGPMAMRGGWQNNAKLGDIYDEEVSLWGKIKALKPTIDRILEDNIKSVYKSYGKSPILDEKGEPTGEFRTSYVDPNTGETVTDAKKVNAKIMHDFRDQKFFEESFASLVNNSESWGMYNKQMSMMSHIWNMGSANMSKQDMKDMLAIQDAEFKDSIGEEGEGFFERHQEDLDHYVETYFKSRDEVSNLSDFSEKETDNDYQAMLTKMNFYTAGKSHALARLPLTSEKVGKQVEAMITDNDAFREEILHNRTKLKAEYEAEVGKFLKLAVDLKKSDNASDESDMMGYQLKELQAIEGSRVFENEASRAAADLGLATPVNDAVSRSFSVGMQSRFAVQDKFRGIKDNELYDKGRAAFVKERVKEMKSSGDPIPEILDEIFRNVAYVDAELLDMVEDIAVDHQKEIDKLGLEEDAKEELMVAIQYAINNVMPGQTGESMHPGMKDIFTANGVDPNTVTPETLNKMNKEVGDQVKVLSDSLRQGRSTMNKVDKFKGDAVAMNLAKNNKQINDLDPIKYEERMKKAAVSYITKEEQNIAERSSLPTYREVQGELTIAIEKIKSYMRGNNIRTDIDDTLKEIIMSELEELLVKLVKNKEDMDNRDAAALATQLAYASDMGVRVHQILFSEEIQPVLEGILGVAKVEEFLVESNFSYEGAHALLSYLSTRVPKDQREVLLEAIEKLKNSLAEQFPVVFPQIVETELEREMLAAYIDNPIGQTFQVFSGLISLESLGKNEALKKYLYSHNISELESELDGSDYADLVPGEAEILMRFFAMHKEISGISEIKLYLSSGLDFGNLHDNESFLFAEEDAKKELLDKEVPSLQQTLGYRKIIQFLKAPFGKKLSNMFFLEGTAGSGKTRMVVKAALNIWKKLTGYDNSNIYTVANNVNTSAIIHKAIHGESAGVTPTNLETLKTADLSKIKVIVADEMAGMTLEEAKSVTDLVDAYNELVPKADKIRIIAMGDPSQVLRETFSPIVDLEGTENIHSIDPLTISFRTSVGVVTQFAENFKFNAQRLSGLHTLSSMDIPTILTSTESKPIGVVKATESEIISMATRTNSGRNRVAIAVSNEVEKNRYRALVDATNTSKVVHVLVYDQIGGTEYDEVYVDIDPIKSNAKGQVWTDKNIIDYNRAVFTATSRAKYFTAMKGDVIVDTTVSDSLSTAIKTSTKMIESTVENYKHTLEESGRLYKILDSGFVPTTLEKKEEEEKEDEEDTGKPKDEKKDDNLDKEKEKEGEPAVPEEEDDDIGEKDSDKETVFDDGGIIITENSISASLFHPVNDTLSARRKDKDGNVTEVISQDTKIKIIAVTNPNEKNNKQYPVAWHVIAANEAHDDYDPTNPDASPHIQIAVLGGEDFTSDTNFNKVLSKYIEAWKATGKPAIRHADIKRGKSGFTYTPKMQNALVAVASLDQFNRLTHSYDLEFSQVVKQGNTTIEYILTKFAQGFQGRGKNPVSWFKNADNSINWSALKGKIFVKVYSTKQLSIKTSQPEEVQNSKFKPIAGMPYLVITNPTNDRSITEVASAHFIRLHPRPLNVNDVWYKDIKAMHDAAKELQKILKKKLGSPTLNSLIDKMSTFYTVDESSANKEITTDASDDAILGTLIESDPSIDKLTAKGHVEVIRNLKILVEQIYGAKKDDIRYTQEEADLEMQIDNTLKIDKTYKSQTGKVKLIEQYDSELDGTPKTRVRRGWIVKSGEGIGQRHFNAIAQSNTWADGRKIAVTLRYKNAKGDEVTIKTGKSIMAKYGAVVKFLGKLRTIWEQNIAVWNEMIPDGMPQQPEKMPSVNNSSSGVKEIIEFFASINAMTGTGPTAEALNTMYQELVTEKVDLEMLASIVEFEGDNHNRISPVDGKPYSLRIPIHMTSPKTAKQKTGINDEGVGNALETASGREAVEGMLNTFYSGTTPTQLRISLPIPEGVVIEEESEEKPTAKETKKKPTEADKIRETVQGVVDDSTKMAVFEKPSDMLVKDWRKRVHLVRSYLQKGFDSTPEGKTTRIIAGKKLERPVIAVQTVDNKIIVWNIDNKESNVKALRLTAMGFGRVDYKNELDIEEVVRVSTASSDPALSAMAKLIASSIDKIKNSGVRMYGALTGKIKGNREYNSGGTYIDYERLSSLLPLPDEYLHVDGKGKIEIIVKDPKRVLAGNDTSAVHELTHLLTLDVLTIYIGKHPTLTKKDLSAKELQFAEEMSALYNIYENTIDSFTGRTYTLPGDRQDVTEFVAYLSRTTVQKRLQAIKLDASDNLWKKVLRTIMKYLGVEANAYDAALESLKTYLSAEESLLPDDIIEPEIDPTDSEIKEKHERLKTLSLSPAQKAALDIIMSEDVEPDVRSKNLDILIHTINPSEFSEFLASATLQFTGNLKDAKKLLKEGMPSLPLDDSGAVQFVAQIAKQTLNGKKNVFDNLFNNIMRIIRHENGPLGGKTVLDKTLREELLGVVFRELLTKKQIENLFTDLAKYDPGVALLTEQKLIEQLANVWQAQSYDGFNNTGADSFIQQVQKALDFLVEHADTLAEFFSSLKKRSSSIATRDKVFDAGLTHQNYELILDENGFEDVPMYREGKAFVIDTLYDLLTYGKTHVLGGDIRVNREEAYEIVTARVHARAAELKAELEVRESAIKRTATGTAQMLELLKIENLRREARLNEVLSSRVGKKTVMFHLIQSIYPNWSLDREKDLQDNTGYGDGTVANIKEVQDLKSVSQKSLKELIDDAITINTETKQSDAVKDFMSFIFVPKLAKYTTKFISSSQAYPIMSQLVQELDLSNIYGTGKKDDIFHQIDQLKETGKFSLFDIAVMDKFRDLAADALEQHPTLTYSNIVIHRRHAGQKPTYYYVSDPLKKFKLSNVIFEEVQAEIYFRKESGEEQLIVLSSKTNKLSDLHEKIAATSAMSTETFNNLYDAAESKNTLAELVSHFGSLQDTETMIGEKEGSKIKYIRAKGLDVQTNVERTLKEVISDLIYSYTEDGKEPSGFWKTSIGMSIIEGLEDKTNPASRASAVKEFFAELGVSNMTLLMSEERLDGLTEHVRGLIKSWIDFYKKDTTVPVNQEIEDENQGSEGAPEGEEKKERLMEPEDWLGNQNQRLKAISQMVSSSNRGVRNNTIRLGNGKKAYKYTPGSYIYDVFNTLSKLGSAKGFAGAVGNQKFRKVPDHLKTDFHSHNIFVTGLNKIKSGLLFHDSITNVKSGRIVEFQRETAYDTIMREFQMAFLDMARGSGTETKDYIQFVYPPSNRPRIPGVRVNILEADQIKDGLKAILSAVQSRPEMPNIDNYDRNDLTNLGAFEKALNELGIDTIHDVDPKQINAFINKVYEKLSEESGEFAKEIITQKIPFDPRMGSITNKLKDKMDVTAALKGVDISEEWEGWKDNQKSIQYKESTVEGQRDEALYTHSLNQVAPVAHLFYLNNFVNGFFVNSMSSGDPAFYKGGKDMVKRMAGTTAAGQKGLVAGVNAYGDVVTMGMNQHYNLAVVSDEEYDKASLAELIATMTTDPKERADILEFFPDRYDSTDAQGFMTPERWHELQKGYGRAYKLSNVLKPLHFENTSELVYETTYATAKEATEAAKLELALVAVGKDVKRRVSRPFYTKYSSIVITNELARNFPALGKIRDKMRNHADENGNWSPIGEMIFKSGIKVGNPVKDHQTKLEDIGTLGFDNRSIVKLKNENYRLQLNPYAKVDNHVAIFTQLMYFMNVLKTNNAKADKAYAAVSWLIENGLDKFKNDVGNTEAKLTQFLKDSLDGPGNERTLQLLAEGVSINNPLITTKSIIQMISGMQKLTTAVKFPGSKLVLQSAYGFDIEGSVLEKNPSLKEDSDRLRYKRDKDTKKLLYAEVIMPSDGLSDEHIAAIKRGEDLFLYKDAFGFRIPSTELHSAVPLKIVGFYDSVGTNVIIAPKELVPLHGSDFDVDSLFIVSRPIFKEDILVHDMETGLGIPIAQKGKPVGFRKDDNGQYIVNEEFDELVTKLINQREYYLRKHGDKGIETDDVVLARKGLKALREIKEQYIKGIIVDTMLETITHPDNGARMNIPISMKELKEISNIKELNLTGKRELDLNNYMDRLAAFKSTKDGAILTGIFANNVKALAYMLRSGEDPRLTELREAIPRLQMEGLMLKESGSQADFKRINDTIKQTKALIKQVRIESRGTENVATISEDSHFSYTGENGDTILFDRIREYDAFDSKKQTWQRLDSLINAAIDNIKEQLLPVIEANPRNANALAALVGLGFPMKSAVILFNHPAILKIASEGVGRNDTTDKMSDLKEEILMAYKPFGDPRVTNTPLVLNDKTLIASLKTGSTKIEELSQQELRVYWEAIQIFEKGYYLGESLRKMAKFLNIVKNLPVTVGDYENIQSALNGIGSIHTGKPTKTKERDEAIRQAFRDAGINPKSVTTEDLKGKYKPLVDKVIEELFTNAGDVKAEKILSILDESFQLKRDQSFAEHQAQLKKAFIDFKISSKFKYNIPNFFNKNSHVTSAYRVYLTGQKLIEDRFKVHSPEFRNFIKQVTKDFNINLAKDEEGATANVNRVRQREEVVKYLMARVFHEELKDQESFSYNTVRGYATEIFGSKAWSQRFLLSIKKAQSLDREREAREPNYFGNIFLKNVTVERNPLSRLYYAGFTAGTSLEFDQILELEQAFKQLNNYDPVSDKITTDAVKLGLQNGYSQFQRDFVMFAALNFGFRFGISNYSQVLPVDIYKEFDNKLQRLIDNFKQSKSTRDWLREHFEVSLAVSNADNLSWLQGKKAGLVPGVPILMEGNREPTKSYAGFLNLTTGDVQKDKTINVYWGNSESSFNSRTLSNLAPREFIYESRKYGSVEHAYQSNKTGTFDQSVYDRGWNHFVGTKVNAPRVTVAVLQAADSLTLMKKLVVASFVQNKSSAAAKKLLSYDNFTHNTNTPIDIAFLEGLKLAQAALGKTVAKAEEGVKIYYDRLYKVDKTIAFSNGEFPKFIKVGNGKNAKALVRVYIDFEFDEKKKKHSAVVAYQTAGRSLDAIYDSMDSNKGPYRLGSYFDPTVLTLRVSNPEESTVISPHVYPHLKGELIYITNTNDSTRVNRRLVRVVDVEEVFGQAVYKVKSVSESEVILDLPQSAPEAGPAPGAYESEGKNTTGSLNRRTENLNPLAKKLYDDSRGIIVDDDAYHRGAETARRTTTVLDAYRQVPMTGDPVVWATERADQWWKWIDKEGNPRENGLDKTIAISTNEGFLTHQEYIDTIVFSVSRARAKGDIIHALIQKVLHPELTAELDAKIDEWIESSAVPASAFSWVSENAKEIFNRLGTNAFDAEYDKGQRDNILSELKIFSKILKMGGTVDILIDHADGTFTIADIKTAFSFKKPHPTVLKYGQAISRNITESKSDMAKLQVALYAFTLMVENPGMKFRNLNIVWAPNGDGLGNERSTMHVDMSNYLDVIKKQLKREEPAVWAQVEALPHFKQLFDPANYNTGYSRRLQKEVDLDKNHLHASMRMALKIQKLKELVQYELNPHVIRSAVGAQNHIVSSKYKAAQKLSLEIAELMNHKDIDLTNWKDDMSDVAKWISSSSSEQSPFIQVYEAFRSERDLKFSQRFQVERRKWYTLLEPVYNNYLRENGLKGTFGMPKKGNFLRQPNPHALWHFAYRLETIDGAPRKVYNITDEDFAKAAKQPGSKRHATKEEMALMRHTVKVMGQFFADPLDPKRGNKNSTYDIPLAEQIATARFIGGSDKQTPVTNLELANGMSLDGKRLPSSKPKRKPFVYDPATFVALVPKTGEEIRAEYGYLSKENYDYIVERYFTFAMENEFEQWNNIEEAIPMKYLPNGAREFSDNFSIDLEQQFDKFMRAYLYKEEMDDVFAFAKGLQYHMQAATDDDKMPMFSNTAQFLETMIELQIRGRKSTGINPFRRGFNTKTNNKFHWAKALSTFKQATVAPIMWLKPVTGTANGIFTALYTVKEGIKGDIVKQFGHTKFLGMDSSTIDFTSPDLMSAFGEVLDMHKTFMLGGGTEGREHHKAWMLAKQFGYLPDNYDWATNSSELMTIRNRQMSTGTMLMFHSLPEETIALIIMIAQMKRMKVEGVRIEGKDMVVADAKSKVALYDMYTKVQRTEDGITFDDMVWRKDATTGEAYIRGYENRSKQQVTKPKGQTKVIQGMAGGQHDSDTPGEFKAVTALDPRELQVMKRVYEKMHGSYRQNERTMMEYYILGELLLQYKKYLPNILRNAFGSLGKVSNLGSFKFTGNKYNKKEVMEWTARVAEGRWRVVGKMMLNFMNIRGGFDNPTNSFTRTVNSFIPAADENYRWADLSQGQKSEAMDFFVTGAMFLMFTGGKMLMVGGVGDDDQIKRVLERIISDFSQQYNVLEIGKNMIENLAPASLEKGYKTVASAWELMFATGWYLGGYEKYATTQEGIMRGWGTFKRSIPFLSSYRDLVYFFAGTAELDEYFTLRSVQN